MSIEGEQYFACKYLVRYMTLYVNVADRVNDRVKHEHTPFVHILWPLLAYLEVCIIIVAGIFSLDNVYLAGKIPLLVGHIGDILTWVSSDSLCLHWWIELELESM